MAPLLLLCLGLVDKREWYDRTLQTCKHGHGGVLVLVSEPQIRRRMSEEAPPPPPARMTCDLLADENTEMPQPFYCMMCDACSGYCPRCDV